MNALSVAWKLRADMLAILAAAAPRGGDRTSESRRPVERALRAKSDIHELLGSAPPKVALVDESPQQASGTDSESSSY